MKREYLAITTKTGLEFVKRDEIMYCLSDGSYTNIYLDGGRKFTISKNLKEVETILSDSQFVRIHNSNLVNFSHVARYVNNGVNAVRRVMERNWQWQEIERRHL